MSSLHNETVIETIRDEVLEEDSRGALEEHIILVAMNNGLHTLQDREEILEIIMRERFEGRAEWILQIIFIGKKITGLI